MTALPCTQDADDLYYDSARRRIYVTGGEGYISVFQQKNADHYEALAKVPSSLGACTSGYFRRIGKKGCDRPYVAVPARANHGPRFGVARCKIDPKTVLVARYPEGKSIIGNAAFMFRTRFKNDIVVEFLPPIRPTRKQRLIILCDGMPSIPRKQPLSEFLAAKGFWVLYPRYRGAWESGGEFLAKSPHEDILDVLNELPKEMEEIAFGQRFRLAPDQVFVIGGSFGGAAAILLSLDPRVKRVVANCPVVDWSILDKAEKAETSKANYADYVRQAFGNAYRLSDANWHKLRSGTFFNPWHNRNEIDGSKVLMFHDTDDPNVPYQRTREFVELTGATLKSIKRGGHISTDYVVRRYWVRIKKFFQSA